MKYPLLITLFALTFASCNTDKQYDWVCTTDSTYTNIYGEQHAITRTTVKFKTKDEIKLIEEKMSASGTDSNSFAGNVATTCKK